jgi:hypothetical protein
MDSRRGRPFAEILHALLINRFLTALQRRNNACDRVLLSIWPTACAPTVSFECKASDAMDHRSTDAETAASVLRLLIQPARRHASLNERVVSGAWLALVRCAGGASRKPAAPQPSWVKESTV